MPFGTRIRVIPRVVANQLAKNRADLYLNQKFFEEIMEGIAAKDRGVLADALQVPRHLNEVRKCGKDAIQEWAALSKTTADPKAHYRAALQRAVRHLSRSGENPERLEAYEALLSGKATDDLKKLLGDMEAIASNIIKMVKNRKKPTDRPRLRSREDDDVEEAIGGLVGQIDTNGDGRIDEDEIISAIGRLDEYLDTLPYGDEDDDDDGFDDEDFGEDDDDEFADDDDFAGEDDELDSHAVIEEVGRGGRGGGGGRGGRGGRGFRGRAPRGAPRRGRRITGCFGGPVVVNYDSDWDLPQVDIAETDDSGRFLVRRKPRVVRRVLV